MRRTWCCLTRGDRLQRAAGPARGAPRLDLDEDQRRAVAHDEVDLAPPGAVIARDEREAQALEVPEREIFPSGAERATWIARAGDGRCASMTWPAR